MEDRDTLHKVSTDSRGFALIYVACIVFLMAVFGVTLLATYAIETSVNKRDTNTLLEQIYRGIIGNPANGTYGYLGDVGNYPSSLADLIKRPASNPVGWNGPYVTGVPFDGDNGWMLDYYGSPLEFFLDTSAGTIPGPHEIAIISRGPDHGSTNTIGNANPNVAANFFGVFPTSTGYTSGVGNSDNGDNFITPNIEYVGVSGLSYYPMGLMTVSLTNSDSATSALRRACPGLYNAVVTSAVRGASDGITVKYGDPNVLDLVQGIWNIQIANSQGAFNYVRDQGVTMMGGTDTHTIRMFPNINSKTTPLRDLTVINNDTGAAIDIYLNGTLVQTVNATKTKVIASQRTCSYAEAKLTSTSTVLDTWVLPFSANSTRVYSGSTRYNLTVVNNGASHRQIGVMAHIPGSTIGSVYRNHAATFNVPNGTTITVTNSNGTSIDSFVVSSGLTKTY